MPECPYCKSKKSSSIEEGLRHHCNDCYTSYSVTVGTVFHKTHVDLQKWFRAIYLVLTSSKVSVRKLAREICVTNNTAASMIARINEAGVEQAQYEMMKMIVSLYEQGD
jgi:transposase-like protein